MNDEYELVDNSIFQELVCAVRKYNSDMEDELIDTCAHYILRRTSDEYPDKHDLLAAAKTILDSPYELQQLVSSALLDWRYKESKQMSPMGKMASPTVDTQLESDPNPEFGDDFDFAGGHNSFLNGSNNGRQMQSNTSYGMPFATSTMESEETTPANPQFMAKPPLDKNTRVNNALNSFKMSLAEFHKGEITQPQMSQPFGGINFGDEPKREEGPTIPGFPKYSQISKAALERATCGGPLFNTPPARLNFAQSQPQQPHGKSTFNTPFPKQGPKPVTFMGQQTGKPFISDSSEQKPVNNNFYNLTKKSNTQDEITMAKTFFDALNPCIGEEWWKSIELLTKDSRLSVSFPHTMHKNDLYILVRTAGVRSELRLRLVSSGGNITMDFEASERTEDFRSNVLRSPFNNLLVVVYSWYDFARKF